MREILLTLKLARRELRSGLTGFYIFLISIIIGVGAIASVLGLSRGLSDSIWFDGRYILGGDIALSTIYDPAPKEYIKFLHDDVGPVTTVMETRAMARRADEADATLVELKAVDPFYPLYGALAFSDENGKVLQREQDGKMVDAQTQDLILPTSVADEESGKSEWGAVVEPLLLKRLNIHIGDYIYIGKKRFQVNGIITREPDRIGNLRFNIAPRVMISSYVFDKTGLSQEGAQVYYDYRIITQYVKTLSDLEIVKKRIVETTPGANWTGRTFADASPQLRRIIEKLTLFLTLIGLTSLLVGGVGIGNAVRSYLDSKLATIATLKCLGASSRLIFRTYLLQIMALSCLGIAVGCGIGLLVPYLSGGLLTSKLDLSNQVGFYPKAAGLAALFGVLVALTFSIWPIGRACEVKPADLFRDLVSPSAKKPGKQAILGLVCAAEALAALAIFTADDMRLAVWFIGGVLLTFGIFLGAGYAIKAAIRRVRTVRNVDLRFALSNLCRPGNVTSGVVLSLGLGLTVLVAVTLIERNFSNLLESSIAKDAPSFFFLDVQQDQLEGFKKTVATAPSARDFKSTPSLRGRIARVNGKSAVEALKNPAHSWVIRSDRGFTYTNTDDLKNHSTLTEGDWWGADYAGAPAVSISTEVAEAFDIGVGDTLTVNILGREVEASVMNVREVEWGSFTMNFAVTFAPGALESFPQTHLATVILDEADELELQRKTAKQFPNVTSIRVRDAMDTAGALIGNIASAVRLAALVTLVSGILVLAGAIAAGHRKKLYDSVILKVLGVTRRRILRGFMIEYGLLGLITAVIASAVGTLAAFATVVYVMDFDWIFNPAALVSSAVLSTSITLILGFFGTWRILGQKPAPMLRNQ